MEFIPDISFFKDQLQKVNVSNYEASRNHLLGSVTYLSPFITHGFEDLPTILSFLKKQKGLTSRHKLFAEFSWREYYHHVWSHLGEAIFQDIRPPIADIQYSNELPADILEARTGLAPIDLAIKELYQTGYLHNHARMWLACYLVHYRKLAWKVCADWMYGYLLDGDLASNHLSWQWVASTFSQKPYLFNAENVAKFSPPKWHCAKTELDQSYENLEIIARSNTVLKNKKLVAIDDSLNASNAFFDIPKLFSSPPDELLKKYGIISNPQIMAWSNSNHLQLIHPWDLRAKSSKSQSLGIIHTSFHRKFPWSMKRWDFVLSRMSNLCNNIIIADLDNYFLLWLKQFPQIRFDITDTLNPFYSTIIAFLLESNDTQVHPIDRFLPNPDIFCPSFSKFWQIVNKQEKFPKP